MKGCCKDSFENESMDEQGSGSGNTQNFSTLKKLKNKWNVKSITHVVLILITFSIGGSICGYLGRKILNLTDLASGPLWVVTYLVLVTLIWPVCVLAVSVFFGQFKFFKGYIFRMASRMFGKKKSNSKLPIE